MNKLLLSFLIGLLFTGFSARAQVVILNENMEDITNDTLNILATIDDDYMKINIFFANNGEEDVEVFVRKIEVDMVDGASNTFCWLDYCFSPMVFEVEEPIILEPEGVSTDTDFYTEFFPGGVAGISQVVYEFYDDRESFEAVQVTINFIIEDHTSVAFFDAKAFGLGDARPNPARDHTWINLDLPAGTSNAQVVVRNLLGNAVITQPVEPGSRRVRIDTSSLNNGIYIYSLIVNNQTVKSKRLVVAN